MKPYKGAYRRQIGGGIFGRGFKSVIPFVFRKAVEILKPHLKSAGKTVGKSLLKAGVGAATNVLDSGLSVENIRKPFKDEFLNLKRQYIPEQNGSGAKRRKKSINKKNFKKINYNKDIFL